MLLMFAKLQARVLRSTSPFHATYTLTRTSARSFLKLQPRQLQWGRPSLRFSSTVAPSSDLSVQYRHGRPVLAVPLPSRQETCLFFLRPMLMTVGDLIRDVQREDAGVTYTTVLTKDGDRVALATSIDSLLTSDFQLLINDDVYVVRSPEREAVRRAGPSDLGGVKEVVHLLHAALHQPEHCLRKERELRERLDSLTLELTPLEKTKEQILHRAESSSSRALWGGLALLSVQGGALAWLTWWVYSWDIMEPVTYFITYSTSIGIFSYFVLTKQDFAYPDAKDRQFLHYFHKGARKHRFDIHKYNQLRADLAQVEEDLKRLRNPNQLQLPLQQIQPKE